MSFDPQAFRDYLLPIHPYAMNPNHLLSKTFKMSDPIVVNSAAESHFRRPESQAVFWYGDHIKPSPLENLSQPMTGVKHIPDARGTNSKPGNNAVEASINVLTKTSGTLNSSVDALKKVAPPPSATLADAPLAAPPVIRDSVDVEDDDDDADSLFGSPKATTTNLPACIGKTNSDAISGTISTAIVATPSRGSVCTSEAAPNATSVKPSALLKVAAHISPMPRPAAVGLLPVRALDIDMLSHPSRASAPPQAHVVASASRKSPPSGQSDQLPPFDIPFTSLLHSSTSKQRQTQNSAATPSVAHDHRPPAHVPPLPSSSRATASANVSYGLGTATASTPGVQGGKLFVAPETQPLVENKPKGKRKRVEAPDATDPTSSSTLVTLETAPKPKRKRTVKAKVTETTGPTPSSADPTAPQQSGVGGTVKKRTYTRKAKPKSTIVPQESNIPSNVSSSQTVGNDHYRGAAPMLNGAQKTGFYALSEDTRAPTPSVSNHYRPQSHIQSTSPTVPASTPYPSNTGSNSKSRGDNYIQGSNGRFPSVPSVPAVAPMAYNGAQFGPPSGTRSPSATSNLPATAFSQTLNTTSKEDIRPDTKHQQHLMMQRTRLTKMLRAVDASLAAFPQGTPRTPPSVPPSSSSSPLPMSAMNNGRFGHPAWPPRTQPQNPYPQSAPTSTNSPAKHNVQARSTPTFQNQVPRPRPSLSHPLQQNAPRSSTPGMQLMQHNSSSPVSRNQNNHQGFIGREPTSDDLSADQQTPVPISSNRRKPQSLLAQSRGSFGATC